MSFLYTVLLKLLYPTSIALVLLLGSALFFRRKVLSRLMFWLAIAIVMVCGNGPLVGVLTRHLERQYLPEGELPKADAVLILSGGIGACSPPRQTVEGDPSRGAHRCVKNQKPET